MTAGTSSFPGRARLAPAALLPYLLLGFAFGLTLVRSEAVSWYRIQEMFRFQSFHMFGLIGTAVATGALGVFLLGRHGIRTLTGGPLSVARREPGWRRYLLGGSVFGLGWGLGGACPGPMFALVGSGLTGGLVLLASAVLGTYLYGVVRPRLPH